MNEALLTPSQVLDTLQWVMRETRDVFLKGLTEDFNRSGNPAYKPDLETSRLSGYCGFAQSFIDMTIRDYDIGLSRPFALQTLPQPFSHVAMTVAIETTEGDKAYLFDPTFRQFCTEQDDSPGTILAHLPGGAEIIQELRHEGFIELTPQSAVTYLSAFNRGIPPFRSEAETMAFFASPPFSKMNNWFPESHFRAMGHTKPDF